MTERGVGESKRKEERERGRRGGGREKGRREDLHPEFSYTVKI